MKRRVSGSPRSAPRNCDEMEMIAAPNPAQSESGEESLVVKSLYGDPADPADVPLALRAASLTATASWHRMAAHRVSTCLLTKDQTLKQF